MPLPTGSSSTRQQHVAQTSSGSTSSAAAAATSSKPSHRDPSTKDTDPLPSTLNAAGTTPAHDAAAADAALYRDMRAALAEFEAQQRKLVSSTNTAGSSSSRPARMEPRQTAFHAALRSVLQQVLAETTPAGRHTRLLAAHAWYVGHRPRPVAADAGLAAAMAASLSIGSGSSSGNTAGQQHPQQPQQQRAGSPSQDRRCCSRAHSPTAAAHGRVSDTSDCSSCGSEALSGSCDDDQQGHSSTHETRAAAAASQHAQRLDTGARQAFVSNWTIVSCGGGGSSGAADVPGLIPVGALPSSRFTCSPPAPPPPPAAAAGAGALPGYRQASTAPPQQQQQQQPSLLPGGRSAWSSVVAQQAALEAQVAVSMRGFARQRARTEEGSSRRQELAALSAATAATGGLTAATTAAPRFLQHLDSQHQPSQVAAVLSGGKLSAGQQLVVPDKVKAARKQHQQEGAQEVVLLQEALGFRDASALARALLPPPDVPYMSAFAQLPAYQQPVTVGAAGGGKKAKMKGTKKKGTTAKKKGGAGGGKKA